MDSNFNPDPKGPENQAPDTDLSYVNMDQGMDGYAPEEAPKKRMGFGAGLGLGAAVGVFATAMICTIVIVAIVVHNKTTADSTSASASSSSVASQVIDQETSDKMDEIVSYLNAYCIYDVDTEAMQDEILHATVDSLGDPYSVYYTKEEYQDILVSTTGSYAGIGAALAQNSNTKEVTVSKVYPDTPAEEAGLLEDDVIQYVNDIDCTTKDLSEIVSTVRGEENTTVHLEVYRPSTGETFDLEVERRQIELTSVYAQMLDNNIGYIQITEFQSATPEQFEAAVKELDSQGMTSMIIDLRNNPGGILDSVINVLDIILPEGTVVYTEDKYDNRRDFTSDAECLDYPMVVLVNGNSASASEIFSGAIQDYDYGTLIGTQTYGKGIVQSLFNLSNGDGLKVTTATYYTPNGNNIQGEGITPDIELEYDFLGTEDQEYDVSLDNQIQYAVEYLSK